MRSKILAGAAAFTLTTTAGLATTTPASAHYVTWRGIPAPGADCTGVRPLTTARLFPD
jgi:hypothetical protein